MTTVIYKPVDGLRYYLEERYLGKREQFPEDQKDYPNFFRNIEDYMKKHVHQEVIIGAALQGYGLLNDHGKEHIAMVIQRAGLILQGRIEDLSGYEIYLLLLAIHFHDVGNIYGRDDHEHRIFEVMEELGTLLPLDSPSKKYVAKIAMAHGGKINDSKDTISTLLMSDYLQGMHIRPALIAAILRFADEIADDHTRACRFLNKTKQIPPRNEVFHRYSECLQQAAIDGNTLILKFDLSMEKALKTCSKENKQSSRGYSKVFLYDEILERLKKCLCELEYCARYSRPFIQINSIRAEIEVHASNILNPLYKDSILLRLCGYPDMRNKPICDLLEKQPLAMNGQELKHQILEKSNAK
ncbi:MAG: hypothetical protein C4527_02825 [Candidatus Omnitrophota bacterium]|jgi:hypothetical protein|nr:MAG: hypothetical protein C4527_02825 [Candidatus Omnitrophota bacterium]